MADGMDERSGENGRNSKKSTAGNCHSLSASRVVLSVARQRWKILERVIKKKSRKYSETEDNSIRRFETFELFEMGVDSQDDETTWYKYKCPMLDTTFSIDIRVLTGPILIEELLGYNNTGNVCVWPSEEVMTYYCLKRKDLFRNKAVCELGGGMTCLAGFTVARQTDASRVLLTDGNDQCIDNAKHILDKNKSFLKCSDVATMVLKWDQPDPCLEGQFDYIISGDCIFFDRYRHDLISIIKFLLKPNGTALMFAPHRGSTILDFIAMCEGKLNVQLREHYDDVITVKHNRMKQMGKRIYDDNIHYPLLLEVKHLD